MKNCREWLEKWLETNYKEIERKERLSKEAEKRKRQEEERVTVPKIVQVESLVEPAKKSLVNRVPFVIRKLVSRKGKIFPMYGLRCRVTKKKKKKKSKKTFFEILTKETIEPSRVSFSHRFGRRKRKNYRHVRVRTATAVSSSISSSLFTLFLFR